MMGKESLYYRFLKKFLDDENYVLLLEAAGQGDSGAAFRAAHTLKGVCGNLGMDRLFGAVSMAVEKLRAHQGEEIPRGFLDSEIQEITKAYEDVAQAIRGAKL